VSKNSGFALKTVPSEIYSVGLSASRSRGNPDASLRGEIDGPTNT
jgi:hypothetical protein